MSYLEFEGASMKNAYTQQDLQKACAKFSVGELVKVKSGIPDLKSTTRRARVIDVNSHLVTVRHELPNTAEGFTESFTGFDIIHGRVIKCGPFSSYSEFI